MILSKLKTKRLLRRKARIRKRIMGTGESPRMSVFRSHKNIYVQLIDDLTGRTLCSASSRDSGIRETVGYAGNQKAARVIGKEIAERAQKMGIQRAVFDRNGRLFHGRIKALADAAREAGLKF